MIYNVLMPKRSLSFLDGSNQDLEPSRLEGNVIRGGSTYPFLRFVVVIVLTNQIGLNVSS